MCACVCVCVCVSRYPEDELLDAARRVEAAIQGGGESGVTHSELLLSHTTDGADEEGNGTSLICMQFVCMCAALH